MMQVMLRALITILLAVIFTALYVQWFQHRSLYIPFKDIIQSPRDIGLEYEDVVLTTQDNVTITGWFVPSSKNERTIYFLHGNGGNVAHRLEKIRFFHDLGCSVFIIDYRGYGCSGGFPTEKGLYRDASAGFVYLTKQKKIPSSHIVLYGESLGAAVAVELALHVPVAGIMMEGAFTSVPDMAVRMFPWLPRIFITQQFDTASKIKTLPLPKLFIHSRNDEVVPFDMTQTLFKISGEPKALLATTGGHNENFLTHGNVIKEKVGDFLAYLQRRRGAGHE